MQIFPAIDLYEKKAVRLLRGDYANMTVYSDKPVELAAEFEKQGADFLHMVDLEGARDGSTPNIDIVKEIAAKSGLFIEIGGGIRDMHTVAEYINAGVGRVILGTAAVTDEKFLKSALEKYGEKIAVGVDIKDGCAAIRGWTEKTELPFADFCKKMQQLGVKTLICTDISRDGAMRGTNIELYGRLCAELDIDIIASGGVSSIDDVKKLRDIGASGAIIGKAYYTGAISLKEAIEVAE